jgi:hypothetical protein
MKRKVLSSIFVLIFIAILAVSSFASALPNRNFATHLTGDEENPPIETSAQGQVLFMLSKDGQTLHQVDYRNIENVKLCIWVNRRKSLLLFGFTLQLHRQY